MRIFTEAATLKIFLFLLLHLCVYCMVNDTLDMSVRVSFVLICLLLWWGGEDRQWQLGSALGFCLFHRLWTLFCSFRVKGVATCYCHSSFLSQLFVEAFANLRKWQLALLFAAWATRPWGLGCCCFYLQTSVWGYVKDACVSEDMQKYFSRYFVFNLCIWSNSTYFCCFKLLMKIG